VRDRIIQLAALGKGDTGRRPRLGVLLLAAQGLLIRRRAWESARHREVERNSFRSRRRTAFIPMAPSSRTE
jgi:hypothetical protein